MYKRQCTSYANNEDSDLIYYHTSSIVALDLINRRRDTDSDVPLDNGR